MKRFNNLLNLCKNSSGGSSGYGCFGRGALGFAGGSEVKRSGRQADIGVQSPRKNKYLPLLREGKSNLLKRTYRLNVLTSYRQKKCAFTLAEVLITLGIIGVVAAMTMPSLVQKHRERVVVTKLKKNYSTIQQAYLMAIQELGTPDLWNLEMSGTDDTKNILYYLKPYLNIAKYCGSEAKGCWSSYTNSLKGGVFTGHETLGRYSKAVLSDGSSILTSVQSASCGTYSGDVKELCAFYRVDINGTKPPNALGKDVFTFYMTKRGVIPAGTALEKNSGYNFETSCRDASSHEGRGCTAWVIYNENMDYLHCSDLSWDGKKTCSGK